jgi:hypothetical protein
MPTVKRRAASFLAAALLATSPAGSVGLGPLTASGLTDNERKGFYLVLINPYPELVRYRLYGIEWDSDAPVARVLIPLNHPALGPNSRRRVLVIDTELARGEEHRFRVCAERADPAEEGFVHARVCSKLIARRIA